ncbi:MAG: P-loop NTPase [Spirochaetales bacterium]|nr:P-loop NTPase [Spirochaetales bacterium]
MTTILPVASGKGGTGKTIFSANLGVTLAQMRKTVVLIDLDLGGSNLHTCLGIQNSNPGIGDLIYKKENNLSALLFKTDIDRLFFIPGDSLLTGTANLDYASKRKIIKQIHALEADFIVLDLGSGSTFNTIDFFLTSSNGIIVTTPETTAILNAYSFLKTALFRLLYRSFPAKSSERESIFRFLTSRIEGTHISFRSLIDELKQANPASGTTVENQIAGLRPKIIINMVTSKNDLAIGSKLRQITLMNLLLTLEYIGFLQKNQDVGMSVIRRKPAVLIAPDCSYSLSIRAIAEKLISSSRFQVPALYESDEDIEELRSKLH